MTSTDQATPTDEAARVLLDGFDGRDGFLFHDGHNQPVHQGGPGLLGLLEARHVIDRWKPQISVWLDETEHFFNHIAAEFDGEAAFEPVGTELHRIRQLSAPLPAQNRFLFQYLTTLTRDLERHYLAPRPPPKRSSTHVALDAAPGARSLNGTWRARYRQGPGEYVEREMELPVNWELVPGIDDHAGSARFTRFFIAGAPVQGRRLVLRFSGVDYFAHVWVNGFYVGEHEGTFGPFEFDVTPYVHGRWQDVNIVRVVVTSPNDPAGPGIHVTSGWHDFDPASAFPNRKSLIKGTLGHHDAKRGGAWNSLTSQDGNTGGIWNDVELAVCAPIRFVTDCGRTTTRSLTQTSEGETTASFRSEFTLENASGNPVEATIRVDVRPANFEGRAHQFEKHVTLRPGANEVALEDQVPGVHLWAPWDQGFPHLYSITSSVVVHGEVQDQRRVDTGFRTLGVTSIGESDGPDGAFVVNGARVFVRGTNLLPTYWLSEYSPERVARDFDMLRKAGFNAVLVHNLVCPRHFYEHADRAGFLVVQMFPLQWSYEQSAHLQRRAAELIREMTGFLANHPCVVSYEVHNEPDMRTFGDVDNRFMDFDLHTALRAADPSRWATTFSSGNHAYPGQFYPLRDDNSFATLPARFLEEEVHGRRISRHRNMPTEFGIQAMPSVQLFRELVSEARVRSALERIRTDPKWIAAGGATAVEANKTMEEAKSLLGAGDWDAALEAFDWRWLWHLGELEDRIRRIERERQEGPKSDRLLVSLKLAGLLLEVLHYGGFKGENFWFGLWRPAETLEDFVVSSQNRQYRLHKDAIENYLNAGVTGPIIGYFSFMFRDADWEAPTWGVVDAAWAPKKAYRAYLESNHPVRATLPHALRGSVKLPGDTWFAAPAEAAGPSQRPWADAEVIVANDTAWAVAQPRLTIWLEDSSGSRVPLVSRRGRTRRALQVPLPAELGPGGGWVPTGEIGAGEWVVPEDLAGGTYFVKARLATDGRTLSTNSYEIHVPATTFPELSTLPTEALTTLLYGAPRSDGFHYWQHGQVVFRASPGLWGFVAGFRAVRKRGIDLYETIQGEHLFRHLIDELRPLEHADPVRNEIWRMRSEMVSPEAKARVLLRYVERFVQTAEAHLAAAEAGEPRPPSPTPGTPSAASTPTVDTTAPARSHTAVGRDRPPTRTRRPPR